MVSEFLPLMTPREKHIYFAGREAGISAFTSQFQEIEESEINPLRALLKRALRKDWSWRPAAQLFLDQQAMRLAEMVPDEFEAEEEKYFRLFNAAPELLAVCQVFVNDLGGFVFDEDDPLRPILARAKIAIQMTEVNSHVEKTN